MNIIEWLDGKKINISAVIGPVLVILITNGYIDEDTNDLILYAYYAWTGIAIGDRVRKTLNKD